MKSLKIKKSTIQKCLNAGMTFISQLLFFGLELLPSSIQDNMQVCIFSNTIFCSYHNVQIHLQFQQRNLLHISATNQIITPDISQICKKTVVSKNRFCDIKVLALKVTDWTFLPSCTLGAHQRGSGFRKSRSSPDFHKLYV